MRLLSRFARGDPRLNRVEAFSDGMFAIIVTLLVLDPLSPDLHDRNSARELGAALVAMPPKLLSWLIRFIIVCKFRLNQRCLLARGRSAD